MLSAMITHRGTGWIAGETVNIFAEQLTPGASVGAAVASPAADSSGVITPSLAPSTVYTAVGATSGRRARFRTAAAAPAGKYLANYFGGDDNPTAMKLYLATSDDMDSWTPYGPPVATGNVFLRDANIIEYAGSLWLVHTDGTFDTVTTTFGLQRSDDGGRTWTKLANVDVSTASGLIGGAVTRSWVDSWFIDPAGLPHVFVSVTADAAGVTPFKRIEVHPTNAAMTTWSGPVLCSTGLPASTLDYCPVLDPNGSTWHLFYKENALEVIQRATGPSFLGPWTTADAAVVPATTQIEASWVVQAPDGKYRLYFDHYVDPPSVIGDQVVSPNNDGWRYQHATTYYSQAVALTGAWSAPVKVPGIGRFPRIRKIDTVDISALRTGARAPYTSLSRAALTTVATGAGGLNIAFDTVNEDVDGMFNTNRAGVATCRNAGVYDLRAYLIWLAGTGAGERFLQITVNGLAPSAALTDKRPCSANIDSHQSCGDRVRLRRGDEVRMFVQQTSGVTLTLGQNPNPTLSLERVGT